MLEMCCNSACKLRGNISSDALNVLKGIMPENFQHLVCKCEGSADNLHAVVRATLSSREEAEFWKQSFNESSHTTLRVLRSKPPVGIKVLSKIEYKCQHKTQPRSPTANYRRGSKNTNCPALVKMTVYRTEMTRFNGAKRASRSSDVHLKDFPALIEIRFCHNHPINAAFVLKHRDVSVATRLKIQQLFLEGHKPTAALEMLKMNLQHENPETYEHLICDRAHCPDLSYVYRLYYKLFKEGCRKRSACARSPQLKESVLALNSNFHHSVTIKEEDGSTENSEQTETFTSAGCAALSASDSVPSWQAQGTCDSKPSWQAQEMCDSQPLQQAQEICDSLLLRQALETCSLFANLEECVAMLKDKLRTEKQYFAPALATFIRKFRMIKSNSHLVSALITFGDSHGIPLPVGMAVEPPKSLEACGLKRHSEKLCGASLPKRKKSINSLSQNVE